MLFPVWHRKCPSGIERCLCCVALHNSVIALVTAVASVPLLFLKHRTGQLRETGEGRVLFKMLWIIEERTGEKNGQ